MDAKGFIYSIRPSRKIGGQAGLTLQRRASWIFRIVFDNECRDFFVFRYNHRPDSSRIMINNMIPFCPSIHAASHFKNLDLAIGDGLAIGDVVSLLVFDAFPAQSQLKSYPFRYIDLLILQQNSGVEVKPLFLFYITL